MSNGMQHAVAHTDARLGMLASAATVAVVAESIRQLPKLPICVVDPVQQVLIWHVCIAH